jgi:hypothetical protein
MRNSFYVLLEQASSPSKIITLSGVRFSEIKSGIERVKQNLEALENKVRTKERNDKTHKQVECPDKLDRR